MVEEVLCRVRNRKYGLSIVGGASIVEAYPTVPRSRNAAPTSTYMGLPEVFSRVGSAERAQPSATKRIVRYHITGS